MKLRIPAFIKAIINTYSVLFFSQSSALGVILLLVTFFNIQIGLSGLGCVVFSLLITKAMGYQRDTIQMGIYSFNALLMGIAMGTFYHANALFFLWLGVACLITVITTIILTERLTKLGLPALSLPFVLTFWIILLAANSVFHTGLQQKSSYLLEEIYSGPGSLAGFQGYLSAKSPFYLNLFFRSLSAVLFQNNMLIGILMSIGLLIHSRITFSLLVIGFVVACALNGLTHTYPDGISYYHLGANFMMTTAAIGSFFMIPSWRSYLWAIVCIPVTFILVNAFTGLLGLYYLPVLSLPFCIINLTLLYFLMLRKMPGKMQLTPVQHYSPERNLYQFLNHRDRLNDLKYFNIQLPFMGSWTVSQGYNGCITHKGDWGHALDFVITDDDKNTYQYPGTQPEHFYCFGKPVLACGDGIVENVVDHVEDNPIGKTNIKENWGNTVVIKHATGLYSKVSHLKKNAIKVKPGDAVKQGDLLGYCGNSGHSPEPHLHFQLQATPYIGSKTLAYPLSYYQVSNRSGNPLHSFDVPKEGDILSSPDINNAIKKAFDLQPGYVATIAATNDKLEVIEVYTDELNQSYLYSHDTGASAYFINSGTQFYFTSFYGDKASLLYSFYLAAYKIVFSNHEAVIAQDVYPIQLTGDKIRLWLQDFVAPFYQFIRLNYESHCVPQKTGFAIRSKQFRATKQLMEATIYIGNNGLQGFGIQNNGTTIEAQWTTENLY
ncbi:urea transporter [Mucilaginibacter agri]|uniref:Peptidoglycan DD-metalloendopeptidase family protein n=1 Tax=Mucilaginibacter agri TaxID=2695265 RepID=A0A966DTP1_9SPHI|nr:urea transporter [Mucilaginibacter agri]NCD69547.1 peptidoglycan DD-metalloendopeptidase family protein [Mucilaginibacter agri]